MTVSLVIPGQNVARTVRACLDSVLPLLGRDGLEEIIFVDDGSTDGTREIVQEYPVRYLRGLGRGPASARNLGWRAARGELIWFMDADCEAESGTLPLLLDKMQDPEVAGAGGSYDNASGDSLLASLIHAEIVQRHLRMPPRVDFLATFNVVYRRESLERLGGFAERYRRAQDAELASRVRKAGGELVFEPHSRVRHHHETRLLPYLRAQSGQAYWRMFLYARHPDKAKGDSYSTLADHVQPPLGLLALGLLPFMWSPPLFWAAPAAALLLAFLQGPMTARLVRRGGARYLWFAPLGFVRALARAAGMAAGLVCLGLARRKGISSGVFEP